MTSSPIVYFRLAAHLFCGIYNNDTLAPEAQPHLGLGFQITETQENLRLPPVDRCAGPN